MANVKIQGVVGGLKTTPIDTDTFELQETANGTSYYTTLGGIRKTVPKSLVVAVSDETTALTTGTAKVTFRMPWAFTLTDVRASVTTAPTGANLVIDINNGGTSIFTTTLSIDATEKTSTTATTAYAFSGGSTYALSDDAEITIDIDQIGSTVAGAGLKIYFVGKDT